MNSSENLVLSLVIVNRVIKDSVEIIIIIGLKIVIKIIIKSEGRISFIRS